MDQNRGTLVDPEHEPIPLQGMSTHHGLVEKVLTHRHMTLFGG